MSPAWSDVSFKLARLDEVGRELRYVPVTTATWRVAAQLWAYLRRTGMPGAPNAALDGDVILAAQARAEDAVIITANTKHFGEIAQATVWTDVTVL